ncbi:MAG: ATP-dependent Clp protease proteolytic subunit [Candidatus Eremiobacteraeota bacterium]|nr:ATP-dependent Clp protease proteolytic subunit [Candidatus Eremiobacteraeota bacterium]
MNLRIALSALVLVAGIATTAAHVAFAKPMTPFVAVIDVDNTIDAGMAHRVQRAVEQAQAEGASAILVVLKTNGGVVDDANDIRDALQSAGIPTIAYVKERAWSAGALIALACDKIYMAPGSSIGAAEPIPSTPKFISAMHAEFVSLAEAHHRNPAIAAAMTDPEVVVAGLKAKGQILSLSATQAKKYHFIDGIADTELGALALAGFQHPRLSIANSTIGERIAQFIADPIVSGLLLTIGFLGLLIEMQTLHLIAGIIGVAALALFFGAHIVAGFSNWVVIAIFALGIVALLFEMHVLPGHGISGTLGALLILLSIVMAFGAVLVGTVATGLSLIAAIALFFLALRWLPQSAFMRRFAFAGAQSASAGYVAAQPVRGIDGAEGVAQTYLRPAGVALIGGTRYQVQTDGDFIPAQTRIRVKRVEGAKIFVTRA